MTDRQSPHDTARPVPQPGALLAGLFLGFASVLLTLGFLWPVAFVFPLIIAGIAAATPFRHHWWTARGALYASVGVAVFELVFVVFLLIGSPSEPPGRD